jgi:hypothetical protein
VPWIVSHPSRLVRRRVIEHAGLEDFANTTLALLGIDERLPGAGRPVFDTALDQEAAYVSWAGPKAWSLYRGGLHYLESELPGPSRNGLFDVAADAAERVPVDDPARAGEMASELAAARDALLAEAAQRQPELREQGELSRELGDRLRALGYAVDSDDADEHDDASSPAGEPPAEPEPETEPKAEPKAAPRAEPDDGGRAGEPAAGD